MKTFEEIKAQLTDILANPDTAPAKLGEVFDELQEHYTTYDTMTKNLEVSDAKIRDLQDTNMKLFLAQTGKREEEDIETENEDVKAVNDFFESFKKED